MNAQSFLPTRLHADRGADCAGRFSRSACSRWRARWPRRTLDELESFQRSQAMVISQEDSRAHQRQSQAGAVSTSGATSRRRPIAGLQRRGDGACARSVRVSQQADGGRIRSMPAGRSGAAIAARACITETAPGSNMYVVAIAWQGLKSTAAPDSACGEDGIRSRGEPARVLDRSSHRDAGGLNAHATDAASARLYAHRTAGRDGARHARAGRGGRGICRHERNRGDIERSSRLADNAHYSIELLTEEIQHAGYFAELVQPAPHGRCRIRARRRLRHRDGRTRRYRSPWRSPAAPPADAAPACLPNRKPGTAIAVMRRVSSAVTPAGAGDGRWLPAGVEVRSRPEDFRRLQVHLRLHAATTSIARPWPMCASWWCASTS